ncbi:hypothetical protein E2F43_10240 [Seongchinamella unica]|uniref:DUF6351 domain-containing protein n=1 Tax=Seongchinamella unica TaxID=2547392 RepID=A0A4V6PIY1_9GAMM|nr:hypothetical protein E2F43_10240 [Seongchinamella unica]
MCRVLLTVGLAVVGSTGASAKAQGASNLQQSIRVVSSWADQVSGGDARIEVTTRGNAKQSRVEVLVNGEDQTDRFSTVGQKTLSGVISGLQSGLNTVTVNELRPKGKGKNTKIIHSESLELTNHPISGPIFSGEHQKAFVCTVQNHGLGQPIPDSTTNPAEDPGWPVYDEGGNLIGRSTTCQVEPTVVYRYRTTGGSWAELTPGERPADLATTTTIDGEEVDYIVRWERGVINRFIYSMAVLDSDPSPDYSPRGDDWNGRLLYYFQGGVAIGHTQGSPSTSRMLYDNALKLGYGVIYSTGTKTGTHYDLELGAETALMTKERFIEAYGTPLYTVSVGGSGGGIQQYVYGQNLGTRLIDAAIPQYSYPDMVTQTIHIGDCELLEYYMDLQSMMNPASPWATWSNRSWLIGLNADDYIGNPYTQAQGTDECVESWRGLSPLALNHLYGYESGIETINPISDVLAIQWTHWEDAVNIYGRGPDGYARSTFDNVGVQYGLQSMLEGKISPAEFLQVNTFVGGWKSQPEMVQETCPYYPQPGCFSGFSIPDQWDPWSIRNMNLYDGSGPAPRTEGSIEAMQAAYEKGHVFVGAIDIPIIDWRHYLEHVLDMHNSHQSFASRQRILNHDGDASNQVIWFTDARGVTSEFDQTPQALAVMDEWMANIRRHPNKGVARNKPARAVDSCFDSHGELIAAGDDVWSGVLDDNPQGSCTAAFPLYSTSRIISGNGIEGGVFKCALQSVDNAIANGVYGSWAPGPAEIAQLNAIFPDGVCDYTQPDMGRP